MRILHTEASTGWGGQEIRILREALAMKDLGHEVFIVAMKGAKLLARARDAGLPVEEILFSWKRAPLTISQLVGIIKKHDIDIVFTHSSLDAWLGGIAARLTGKKIIRTRHLSTSVRAGLNSYLLYNLLADKVVTTCEECAETLRRQARLTPKRCLSIPTGIDTDRIVVQPEEAQAFRKLYGIQDDDVVVGTLCVVRSWKGLDAFLDAAFRLRHHKRLQWLVVGDGPCFTRYRDKAKDLGLEVLFTGHLEKPLPAVAAMDIFALLSTANEGVSQASLQAAYLQKPLITTDIGGLKEVCIPGETGFLVPCRDGSAVADAVTKLLQDRDLRRRYGTAARHLTEQRFCWRNSLQSLQTILAE